MLLSSWGGVLESLMATPWQYMPIDDFYIISFQEDSWREIFITKARLKEWRRSLKLGCPSFLLLSVLSFVLLGWRLESMYSCSFCLSSQICFSISWDFVVDDGNCTCVECINGPAAWWWNLSLLVLNWATPQLNWFSIASVKFETGAKNGWLILQIDLKKCVRLNP